MSIIRSRELDSEHMKSETVGIKEAAELLKMHPHSVEKLIRGGEIAGAKIGRSWVMMRRDVLTYIERTIMEQTADRLIALGKIPLRPPQRRRRNFR